jgi:transcriptional regulator with XRE-family HTH domain
MTQQGLATAAGLSVSLIAQIEQGTNPDPKLSTVQRIARALGVRIEALAGDDESRDAPSPSSAAPAPPPAEELQAEAKRKHSSAPGRAAKRERPPEEPKQTRGRSAKR